jgi:hypothetical protein
VRYRDARRGVQLCTRHHKSRFCNFLAFISQQFTSGCIKRLSEQAMQAARQCQRLNLSLKLTGFLPRWRCALHVHAACAPRCHSCWRRVLRDHRVSSGGAGAAISAACGVFATWILEVGWTPRLHHSSRPWPPLVSHRGLLPEPPVRCSPNEAASAADCSANAAGGCFRLIPRPVLRPG